MRSSSRWRMMPMALELQSTRRRRKSGRTREISSVLIAGWIKKGWNLTDFKMI